MRIDKYLKNARLIKRRTIAKEACEQERVSLNGKTAKPGSEVKAGDVIEVRFGQSLIRLEVLSTPEHVTKEDALGMYRMLS